MCATGAQVGTVLTMPISGLLCDVSWDLVFYVFGIFDTVDVDCLTLSEYNINFKEIV